MSFPVTWGTGGQSGSATPRVADFAPQHSANESTMDASALGVFVTSSSVPLATYAPRSTATQRADTVLVVCVVVFWGESRMVPRLVVLT